METVSTFKALPPDSPVVPLGMAQRRFVYRTPSGFVERLSWQDHTRLRILALFEDQIPFLHRAFPRKGRDKNTGEWIVTGWMPELVAEALMQAAAAQGAYINPAVAAFQASLKQGAAGHDAGILTPLLFTRANCAREDYQDILLRLHRGQGSDADRRVLGDAGMAYIDERSALAIAHNCQAIADAFRDSSYIHTHYPRLRALPGVLDGAMVRIGGVTRRCILIPMTTVAELMPEVPW